MHRSVLLVLKESKTELQLWRCIAFGCLRHALLTRTWYVHKMLPSQGFPLRLILTGLQHQAAVTPCDSSHWLCHYNFISHRSSTPPNMRTSKVMGFFVLLCFLHTPSDLADRTFLRFPQQFYFNSGQAQLYNQRNLNKMSCS